MAYAEAPLVETRMGGGGGVGGRGQSTVFPGSGGQNAWAHANRTSVSPYLSQQRSPSPPSASFLPGGLAASTHRNFHTPPE